MPGSDDVGDAEVLRARLRTAACISLAAGLLFVPLEAQARTAAELPWVLAVWGIHIGLSAVAVGASLFRLSARWIDRLGLALVLGYVANAHLYLFVVPPRDVGLVGEGLTIVLFVGAVFFSWSWRRTLLVSILACTSFAAAGLILPRRAAWVDSTTIVLAGLLVGATIATASASILGQFRERLARRQGELAALSARLMSVQEEAQRRISRELHDEVGQLLTALNAHLWLLERASAGDLEALRGRTAEARRLVSHTARAIRELSGLLRPVALDDFGLVPSLDADLKAFEIRHDIATSLTVERVPERLPAEVETALYRIAQEALTNVARHAHARSVRVRLAAEDRHLRLDIEDDGVGLPRPTPKGLGLLGIHERVRALGGTVSIASSPGASITVRVPLPGAA
jgi:signal transduction histidine kinase